MNVVSVKEIMRSFVLCNERMDDFVPVCYSRLCDSITKNTTNVSIEADYVLGSLSVIYGLLKIQKPFSHCSPRNSPAYVLLDRASTVV